MEDLNYTPPKKRKEIGIDLNKKPRKRRRLGFRPRIYDATKPKKIPTKKVVKARVPRSDKKPKLSCPKKLSEENSIGEIVSGNDSTELVFDSSTPSTWALEPLSLHRPTSDKLIDIEVSSCRRALNFDLETPIKDEEVTNNGRIVQRITHTYHRRKSKGCGEISVFNMLINILGSKDEDFGSSAGMKKVLEEYKEDMQCWIPLLEGFPKGLKKMRTKRNKRCFLPNLAKAVKLYNGYKVLTKKRSDRQRSSIYKHPALPTVAGKVRGKKPKSLKKMNDLTSEINLVSSASEQNLVSEIETVSNLTLKIDEAANLTSEIDTVSMDFPPLLNLFEVPIIPTATALSLPTTKSFIISSQENKDQVVVDDRLVTFNNQIQQHNNVKDANWLVMQQQYVEDANSVMVQQPFTQYCAKEYSPRSEVVREETDVEFIVKKLQSLHIMDINMQDFYQKTHYDLVPYQKTRELVPVKIKRRKKRKPIPKVNLDDETLRVWDILMGNNKNAPTREDDEEKEEYWERERQVFSRRVDAFISCMHLVQGNRKFSRWKGSVVDSVVGVYLTQNVSDNLSSTAYMSLASKFPLSEYDQNNSNNGVEHIVTSQESSGDYFVTEEFTLSQESTGSNDVFERLTSSGVDKTQASNIQEYDTYQMIEENRGTFSRDASENKVLNYMHDTGEISYSCSTYNEDDYSLKEKNVSSRSFDSNSNPQTIKGKLATMKGCLEENMMADSTTNSRKKNKKLEKKEMDWDEFREKYSTNEPRTIDTMDSVNWDEVRCAPVEKIAKSIAMRGQHNILAAKIKAFLDRVAKHFGNIDLECLRTAPPDVVKDFLLSIDGIGLKSAECVRLLALEHHAFPVDTNVGRIVTRLGWVPLQPLPGNLELDLLTQYPLVDAIQKYLWPRLCHLHQRILYVLHYQLITFGKVFCSKRNPKCGECPMRSSCRYYACKFARKNMCLPAPHPKSTVTTNNPCTPDQHHVTFPKIPPRNRSCPKLGFSSTSAEPIIEYPESPERECTEKLESNNVYVNSDSTIVVSPPKQLKNMETTLGDIEDMCHGSDNVDDEDIPTITLDTEEFKATVLQVLRDKGMHDLSKALVPITLKDSSPTRLKIKSRLWTGLQV
ncbi:OLC1v1008919C1 [Oldenlandia corymbosa var. corymbosa]|uniref:OLC1v1008919C1 n=1 Tax=Oldenlandia corymbosa var. corymbosa TaxID=529605 RepID=A0AAV1DQJ1_OLDCO|nr:OLC1v1008919C1 [Oldenlandia corymbosa var. corymbosa]